MWFKKKSVLQGEGHYNNNTAYDGTDWRTNSGSHTWPASYTLPSAADAGKYFYLPTLGIYNSGQLLVVGYRGYYWSSSAKPQDSGNAYYMYFSGGGITVTDNSRYGGARVGGFE